MEDGEIKEKGRREKLEGRKKMDRGQGRGNEVR